MINENESDQKINHRFINESQTSNVANLEKSLEKSESIVPEEVFNSNQNLESSQQLNHESNLEPASVLSPELSVAQSQNSNLSHSYDLNPDSNIDSNLDQILNQSFNHESNSNVREKNVLFPLTFIICSITCIFFFNKPNTTLILYPVISKNQFYRIMTNYFFHESILHLVENLIFFQIFIRLTEKKLGTFYTFVLCVYIMILSSLIYLLCMLGFKYLFKTVRYNSKESFGLSPLIFGVGMILFLLEEVQKTRFTFLGYTMFKGKDIIKLFILYQFINPNVSIFGNLCGILSGIFIYNGFLWFLLPKFDWVFSGEEILNLSNHNTILYFIGYSLCDDEVLRSISEINYFCGCSRYRNKFLIESDVE